MRSNVISWPEGSVETVRRRIESFAAVGIERLILRRGPGQPVSEIDAFGRMFIA
jgi:hypothetical protein